jgi:hypothetical protein
VSETVVDQENPAPPPAPGQAPAEPHLGWALAGLSAGAGVIHIAMTPIHAGSAWQEALGFAAAGWFQLVTAGVVLANRASTRFYQLVAVANLVFVGVWIYSRTVGLPFGENPGVAESVGAIDAVCAALEVGVVLLAARLAMAPEKRSVGRLAPAMCAVAALGLATVVITSPDAANHSHDGAEPEPTGLEALQIEVDEQRCDEHLNPAAYWEEAEYLGMDTRWGGNPPAVEGAAMSSDGHAHGGAATAAGATTTTTDPDPLQGRGSPGVDKLISDTGQAALSEGAAAVLITSLSKASQDDYDAWLWWLRSSGSLAHEHSTSAEGDGSGHGGHVGPQPWVAMTDQELCDQVDEELALARETAMTYATAQDAKDAGYRLVTGYVPGIAAHWIKSDLIDDTFEIDKPEMILYDGNGLDANVVGLSYYQWHAGDNKPTQGFTGDNDHAHRHIGLCSSKATGQIIGDSTTTVEDCEARGGSKSDGSKGWMSHAWVVEGCESPWGVFSAASPVLDDQLGDSSGKDGGHCAGSGVRERYGMDDEPAPKPSSSATGEASRTTGDTTGN